MEIELKLALNPADAGRLRRHPRLAGVKPVVRQLHSIYLDTPAWDLMQRGIALRVRRIGKRWVQTLKAETATVGALSRRPEWEVALPRGHHDLSLLPEEALALLKGMDTGLICPAFATDFRRTAWQLESAGAGMEVALDEGEIRVGGHAQPLCEVEIELKSGAREALFDLALDLLQDLPLGVEPRSKAMRGYVLAGAIEPRPVKAMMPRLDAAMDAGQAWTLLAEAALAQMVGNVPGFMAMPEELEYLHQLRIGVRRLRTVAAMAASLGRATPSWDEGLRTLMQVLNGARDWDVLLAEILPRAAAALSASPLGLALRQRLQREAMAERKIAMTAIAAPEFTRLVLEIGRNLLSPAIAEQALLPWAAARLEARWQRLLKRGKGFARLDAAQRHRVRIAAKRMRYTADVLAAAFAHSDKFITRLATLQDRLGAMQDAVVATRLIGGMHSRSAQILFDAGRVVGVLAGEGEGHDRGGAKAWQALLRTRRFWKVS